MKSPSGKEGFYRWSKAIVLSKLNRNEDALEECKKAVKVISSGQVGVLFDIHMVIAQIMKKGGNYKEVLKELSIAISFYKNAFAFGKVRFEDGFVHLEFPKGKVWNVAFIFSETLRILSEVEKIPASTSKNFKEEKNKILNQASFIIFRLKDWEVQSAIET